MMAHKTTYTCDQCGNEIGPLYGPLFVSIDSVSEPQVSAKLELCSFNCLEKYITRGHWERRERHEKPT